MAALFKEGNGAKCYPLAVRYSHHAEANPGQLPQVAFSVSKKRIRRAHERQRIRRRIREAYRQNKHLLPPTYARSLLIMWVYLPSQLESYQRIEKAVVHILQTIGNQN